jgi:hypothetical protein
VVVLVDDVRFDREAVLGGLLAKPEDHWEVLDFLFALDLEQDERGFAAVGDQAVLRALDDAAVERLPVAVTSSGFCWTAVSVTRVNRSSVTFGGSACAILWPNSGDAIVVHTSAT